MKPFLISFFLIILLWSCYSKSNSTEDKKDSKSAEEIIIDSLYNEVMRVHDDVMPKMDDIMQLQMTLSDSKDSLNSNEDQIDVIIKRLEVADAAMMSWMRSFDSSMEGMTDQMKIDYLREEYVKMDSISQLMYNAINDAILLEAKL